MTASEESESPKAEALVSNDLMQDEASDPENRYLDYNYSSENYGYNSLSPYYQSNSQLSTSQLLRKQMLLKQQLARQQLMLQQLNSANSLRLPQARQGLAQQANRYDKLQKVSICRKGQFSIEFF